MYSVSFVSNLWGARSIVDGPARALLCLALSLSLSLWSQTLVPANWQTSRRDYGRPLSAAVAIKLPLEKVVCGCRRSTVTPSSFRGCIGRPIRMQMVASPRGHRLCETRVVMSALSLLLLLRSLPRWLCSPFQPIAEKDLTAD